MNSAVQERQTGNPWLARSVAIDAIVPDAPGVATYHLRFRNARDAAN